MTARFTRNAYFERAHQSADSAWPELPPLPDPTPWWDRTAWKAAGAVVALGSVWMLGWYAGQLLAAN